MEYDGMTYQHDDAWHATWGEDSPALTPDVFDPGPDAYVDDHLRAQRARGLRGRAATLAWLNDQRTAAAAWHWRMWEDRLAAFDRAIARWHRPWWRQAFG